MQVSYTPAEDLTLNSLQFGFYTDNATTDEYDIGNFKITVEYSTDASFASPVLIQQDIQVGDMVIIAPDYYVVPGVHQRACTSFEGKAFRQ